MRVGPLAVPIVKPDLPDLGDVASEFEEALLSGRVTNFGPVVQAFERAVADYVGVSAVAVSSGTIGLTFSLWAAGVGLGDRVAIPSFTFMATAQAVTLVGAIPVFVDIGDDLTMDPDDLATVFEISGPLAAVVPVHMYGMPCDVDALAKVAADQAEPPALIFDAAHAFGAARDGVQVGTSGTAEVFSLSATKVLVAIEGGLVTSSDGEFLDRIRAMRNYGIDRPYDAGLPGVNGKMSELHAAVGLFNLRRLPDLMARREERAARYRKLLLERCRSVPLPVPAGVSHTFKDFTVLAPGGRSERDTLMRSLRDVGVETRAYFDPPVHRQRRFAPFADRELPRTDAAADRVITLPFFTTITDTEMDYVVDALAAAERELLP